MNAIIHVDKKKKRWPGNIRNPKWAEKKCEEEWSKRKENNPKRIYFLRIAMRKLC